MTMLLDNLYMTIILFVIQTRAYGFKMYQLSKNTVPLTWDVLLFCFRLAMVLWLKLGHQTVHPFAVYERADVRVLRDLRCYRVGDRLLDVPRVVDTSESESFPILELIRYN